MLKLLLAAAAGCMLASSAQAAITFTTANVTFSDGATASGRFTTDDAATSVTNFDIATTQGYFSVYDEDFENIPAVFAPAFNYNKDTSSAAIFSEDGFTNVYFVVADQFNTGRVVNFSFVTPSKAGDYSLRGSEGEFIFEREVESGMLHASQGVVAPNPGDGGPTAGVVPEPSMWAMMIGGFGLVGSKMRRRKGTVATDLRLA